MRRMIITAAVLLAAGAGSAFADCQKLGFSVNDYGKDGPTQDAKKLLDTYIAQWAANEGISKYRASKKDVSCELFLDFGVFDEHTCKATATVCWNKRDKGKSPLKAKSSSRKPKSASAMPDKKVETTAPAKVEGGAAGSGARPSAKPAAPKGPTRAS